MQLTSWPFNISVFWRLHHLWFVANARPVEETSKFGIQYFSDQKDSWNSFFGVVFQYLTTYLTAYMYNNVDNTDLKMFVEQIVLSFRIATSRIRSSAVLINLQWVRMNASSQFNSNESDEYYTSWMLCNFLPSTWNSNLLSKSRCSLPSFHKNNVPSCKQASAIKCKISKSRMVTNWTRIAEVKCK